ncbi:general transcription factor IIH subunit 2 isoform X2 [Benincasa hispida]|uniref:general transcription factor IIH subunit 2 isoform X2 n=1 Tax=Benincasa hispida TaxID=102211 RepID=UPI00190108A3|nr:general transcription factor IIH subunit 2 isoform X2 [Benincasa hispida]
MNNGENRRLNGEADEEDDDDDANGGLAAWERTYADDRSWEALQEDESGLLRPIDNKAIYHAQYRRRLRSLSSLATTARIQKGLIRYLYIVIDFSRAATEMDFRPSRMAVVAKHVEAFVREFFDQNPLSQIGLVTIKDGVAHCLTDLGGSPESHVKALMGKLECSGDASLQNGLELVHGFLNQIPSYGHREVLILYSALNSCDPGDIMETVQKCKTSKIRCSVIGLTAEIFICRHLCQETGGSYSIALDEDLKSGMRIDTARHDRGLYFLSEEASSRDDHQTGFMLLNFPVFENDFMLWHFRLGHLNFQYMKYLFPYLFRNVNTSLNCDVCIRAKQSRVSFWSQPYKPAISFSLVHSDVWGPSPVTTSIGKRWFVTFIDDHTRLTWVFLLTDKSEVSSIF